jgi:hypothetical protein
VSEPADPPAVGLLLGPVIGLVSERVSHRRTTVTTVMATAAPIESGTTTKITPDGPALPTALLSPSPITPRPARAAASQYHPVDGRIR